MARAAARIAAAALLAAAAWVAAGDAATARRYGELAEEATMQQAEPERRAGPEADGPTPAPEGPEYDWDALRAQSPEIAAWVVVEGTSIDSPVAQREGDNSFYLSHDLWGSWSQQGCPFLDCRCDAGRGAQLVYGHHFNWTHYAFSDLYDAWEQERFDALGCCWWSTPRRRATRLEPICSLRVDRDDMGVQTFDFEAAADRREWLEGLCRRADAKAGDWEERAARARRTVTLVTCSSLVPGQRWRTATVFCG